MTVGGAPRPPLQVWCRSLDQLLIFELLLLPVAAVLLLFLPAGLCFSSLLFEWSPSALLSYCLVALGNLAVLPLLFVSGSGFYRLISLIF